MVEEVILDESGSFNGEESIGEKVIEFRVVV